MYHKQITFIIIIIITIIIWFGSLKSCYRKETRMPYKL